MSDFFSYTLSGLKDQIRLAIRNSAILIYFFMNIEDGGSFDYCTCDKGIEGACEGVKLGCTVGGVSDIRPGEVFVFEGVKLWPMDVFFVGAPCHPYMLLRENGLVDDADYTPYFFVSRKKRDSALDAIRPVLLERSQLAIRSALQNQAKFVYYDHGETTEGFKEGCNEKYKDEMRKIKSKCFSNVMGSEFGQVTDIRAGMVLVFEGRELWPIEVIFSGQPCGSYPLLRQNEIFTDAESTPYFFMSRTKRDEVFNIIRHYIP